MGIEMTTVARDGVEGQAEPVDRTEMLPTIQILRAVAAILVVVAHGYLPFELGRVGVDLFFVISGFIMVYVGGQAFEHVGAPYRFLRNRLLRIVPTYWVCTGLVIALYYWHGHRPDPCYILGSLFFLPCANVDGSIMPILPTGWTLNFEMFFYSIFALNLWLPKRIGLISIFATLVVLVALGVMFKPKQTMLIYWLHPMLLEFAAGMAIALLRERLTIGRGLGLAMVAVGVAILASFWQMKVPDRFVDNWLPIYWGISSSIIVAGLGWSDRGQALPRWFQPALFLGSASYSIYLAHYIVLAHGPAFVTSRGPLAIIAGGIIAGIVLHLLVERPTARYFRKAR